MKNKMKKTILIICLSIIFASLGCLPYRFVTRPGASGQVVDLKTNNPVAGAKASLVSTFNGVRTETETMTSNEGFFHIYPERKWGLFIVPMDPARISGDLTINADGYVDFNKTIHTNTMGKAVIDLGPINMERLNK